MSIAPAFRRVSASGQNPRFNYPSCHVQKTRHEGNIAEVEVEVEVKIKAEIKNYEHSTRLQAGVCVRLKSSLQLPILPCGKTRHEAKFC
jgi:hypothetical protein